jgi:N,N'-diacetyllegionaminate synthase
MVPWRSCVRAVRDRWPCCKCTSAYPVQPARVGLNVLGEIRQRYGCAAGLSDHSGTIFPALGAVTLDAAVIEVHVTLSCEMFGPDAGRRR